MEHTRGSGGTRSSPEAAEAEAAAPEASRQEKDPEKVLLAAPGKEKAQSLLRLFAKLTTK